MAIILAGCSGSCLYLRKSIASKLFIAVCDKPLAYFLLAALMTGGIGVHCWTLDFISLHGFKQLLCVGR